MKSPVITIAAAAIASFVTLVPANSQDVSALSTNPAGTWQSTTGEQRYEVTLCGDGTQLCAKLTWLSPDVRTDENLAYLNEYVISGASRSAANRWRGSVVYEGETFSGSVTLVEEDFLRVNGCKGLLCQSMDFVRI